MTWQLRLLQIRRWLRWKFALVRASTMDQAIIAALEWSADDNDALRDDLVEQINDLRAEVQRDIENLEGRIDDLDVAP